MDTAMRRSQIENLLKESDEPVTGSRLAEVFDVSRQVIVGDIAILRAKGIDIIATPQGYFVAGTVDDNKYTDVIISSHSSIEELEDELTIIVDNGGRVIDVIVDHSVYGEIRSGINVSSRREVENFVGKLKENGAKPISSLTEGVHLHTIETKDSETFAEIAKVLKEKGYLIE